VWSLSNWLGFEDWIPSLRQMTKETSFCFLAHPNTLPSVQPSRLSRQQIWNPSRSNPPVGIEVNLHIWKEAQLPNLKYINEGNDHWGGMKCTPLAMIWYLYLRQFSATKGSNFIFFAKSIKNCTLFSKLVQNRLFRIFFFTRGFTDRKRQQLFLSNTKICVEFGYWAYLLGW